MRRASAILPVSVVMTAALWGGSEPHTQQPGSFRASVNLVQVDVRVFDADGEFVSDLTLPDFELREDGVLRPIETFFLVRASPPDAAGESTHRSPVPSHVWVFYFDDRHMQIGGFRRAREGVRLFLREHFRRGDMAAIVFGDALMNGRISSDPDEILTAMARIKQPTDRKPEGGEASWMALQLAQRGYLNTIDTLEALMRGLAYVPGPKTVVLLSDGFPYRGILGSLRRTVEPANAAGARIYAIDTRGLAGPPAHTLNSLAVDTGGMVLFNRNDIERALLLVAQDSGQYYMLGFAAGSTVYDGRFHRIDVRVKRPNLRVRARKGYLAIDPREMQTPRPIRR